MKMYIFALGRTGALYVSPFLEVNIGRSCSGCVKDILGAVGGCYIMYIALVNATVMLLNPHKHVLLVSGMTGHNVHQENLKLLKSTYSDLFYVQAHFKEIFKEIFLRSL